MRRYYKKKAYKKARKFYETFSYMEEKDLDRLAKKHGDNLKVCSCWMCCSPRKLYGNSKEGKTLQEIKNLYNCE